MDNRLIEIIDDNKEENKNPFYIDTGLDSPCLEKKSNKESFSLVEDAEPESLLKQNSFEEYEEYQKKKKASFLSRIFAPLNKGSIRSSVITLLSGSAGSGILCLPKIFSYYGVLTSII